MRSLSLLCVLAFLCNTLSAQYVYTIKADSVKLTNCDSSELIIENHTQAVPGFLFNTGNGRTIFKRGLQKLNDSLYLIGADTLRASKVTAFNGLSADSNTIMLGQMEGQTGNPAKLINNREVPLNSNVFSFTGQQLNPFNVSFQDGNDDFIFSNFKSNSFTRFRIDNTDTGNSAGAGVLLNNDAQHFGYIFQSSKHNAFVPDGFSVVNNGGTGGINLVSSAGPVTFGNYVNAPYSAGEYARFTNTGNLLLGQTTDNGSKLQVNGPSYFNGTQVITGTVVGTADPTFHSLYMPTVTAGPGQFASGIGTRMTPTLNAGDDYQTLYALDIDPTYRLNGYLQHTDAISAALHVGSRFGGVTIEQDSSYNGYSGQPLAINQSGFSNKEAIRNYRNGNLTNLSFIWNLDNRPAATQTLIVPALRSTISTPQAGAGISFTIDRFYYGTEASIDLLYETTPDSTANRNTSIAFNTITSSAGPGTPLYINGNNVGMGTKLPAAQLHTTGSVRFAGLTSDNTQTRVLVSDANGNLFYRDASTLAANDLPRSSLAVNGPITAEKLTLKAPNWPDYVFDSAYHLLSLPELKAYLQLNHHLPGIASAAVTEKNGVDVGTTQAGLLKKIEELTLYTIDQDKKITDQKSEIDTLTKRMEALEKLIRNK